MQPLQEITMIWRELAFSIESTNDAVLVIDDERAKVINDPLRWLILETIGAEKTVAEIARELGITDARVLHHVTRLAETNILHLEEVGADARRWRCWPLVGKLRVCSPTPEDQDSAEAIPNHVAADFNQAFREKAEGVFGASRQVSLNHNRARLSEEQASEFSRRLLALIEEYFPPGKGNPSGIKYGFYGVLTPIDLHPLEDDE